MIDPRDTKLHLTEGQYTELMHRMGLLAGLLVESGAEIRAALDILSKADAIGPFINPTRWIHGGAQNLEDVRDLLAPLAKAAADLAPLIERVKARAEVAR